MDASTIIGLIILFILLLTRIYLSLAESSILSVTVVQGRRMAEDNLKGAKTLVKVLEGRSNYLTTVLLLTLVNDLAASSIASTLAYRYFKSWGVAAATAILTLIIFVYCEVAPKTYAVRYADKTALRFAGPVTLTARIFWPVVNLLSHIAILSMRLIGVKVDEPGPYMSEEELMAAVRISEEEGVIEEEEKKLIHHIFEFGDTIVREVMVPRPDMICVSDSASTKEALEYVLKEGHSRLPVYKENIDNIVGILYARDLLALLAKGGKPVKVKALMRPAVFVPETKRVAGLLREIQKGRVHLAIVIDEYGSTAGLVTMEDLLEEIFGEIYDEYDAATEEIETVGEGRLRVDGRAPVDDVSEYFDIKLDYPEVDSIGGLMLELFGRVPERGESMEAEGLLFKIDKVTGKRVIKVMISRVDEAGINKRGG